MYKFKIKDEYFARGFMECPSDDLNLRTAYGLYKTCAECSLDLFSGIPHFYDFNGMSIFHTYACALVDIGKLKKKAKEEKIEKLQ